MPLLRFGTGESKEPESLLRLSVLPKQLRRPNEPEPGPPNRPLLLLLFTFIFIFIFIFIFMFMAA